MRGRIEIIWRTSPHRSDRLWGQPNNIPRALSLGVKRQGREAAHSPPTNTMSRKLAPIQPPPPPNVLIAKCLVG
jgi:hypothetical protein